MDCVAIIIVIILIILIWFYYGSYKMEKMMNLTGVYTLMPMFDSSIQANPAIKLQINPQRVVNPSYLNLIVTYADGKIHSVKTNQNVGNVYTYYDDYSNVLYLSDPTKIQYDLNIGTNIFKALTSVNGNSLQLLTYKVI